MSGSVRFSVSPRLGGLDRDEVALDQRAREQPVAAHKAPPVPLQLLAPGFALAESLPFALEAGDPSLELFERVRPQATRVSTVPRPQ